EPRLALRSSRLLFPDQDVGQRAIEPPQQRIADAREPAEQSEIELPLADIPAIVAARSRTLHDRRQAPRRMVAQVALAKRVRRLAKELEAAERAATQRVDVAGPAALHADKRIAHVLYQQFGIQIAALDAGGARDADARSAVAPLARPGRSLAIA